jgi:hypothetical protein
MRRSQRSAATSRSSTSLNTTAAASQTLSLANTIVSQGQTQVVNVLDQVPGVEVNHVGGGSNEPGCERVHFDPRRAALRVASSSRRASGRHRRQRRLRLQHDVHQLAACCRPSTSAKAPVTYRTAMEDAIGGTVNFRTPNITPERCRPKPSPATIRSTRNYYGVTPLRHVRKGGRARRRRALSRLRVISSRKTSTAATIKYEPYGLPVTPRSDRGLRPGHDV